MALWKSFIAGLLNSGCTDLSSTKGLKGLPEIGLNSVLGLPLSFALGSKGLSDIIASPPTVCLLAFALAFLAIFLALLCANKLSLGAAIFVSMKLLARTLSNGGGEGDGSFKVLFFLTSPFISTSNSFCLTPSRLISSSFLLSSATSS